MLTARNALPTAAFTLAQNLSTRGLQGWIQDNIVPLILLGIAIMLLWIGGRGDNAGVARRSVGLIVGLIALGIAVSGNGPFRRSPIKSSSWYRPRSRSSPTASRRTRCWLRWETCG